MLLPCSACPACQGMDMACFCSGNTVARGAGALNAAALHGTRNQQQAAAAAGRRRQVAAAGDSDKGQGLWRSRRYATPRCGTLHRKHMRTAVQGVWGVGPRRPGAAWGDGAKAALPITCGVHAETAAARGRLAAAASGRCAADQPQTRMLAGLYVPK